MNQTEGRYKVEVIADNSGKWCSNALRFDTVAEADIYGADLASRWMLVRRRRVFDTETDQPVPDTEHRAMSPIPPLPPEPGLVGQTIIKVRRMTAAEAERVGWGDERFWANATCVVIELDNGICLYPSSDDEGNRPGVIWGYDPTQTEKHLRDFTLYVRE